MCVPRQQGSVGGRSLPNSWFRCTHLVGKTHASIFFSQGCPTAACLLPFEEGGAGARQKAP